MNQIFSFRRFRLLVLKHWADNRVRYLLSVLAFIGLLILWFLFTFLVESNTPLESDIQLSTYLFLLFTIGSFYASQYFSDLGSKIKGASFLLVPGSTLEKLLCGLLYNVVLVFVVFTAAFYLVDLLAVAAFNSIPALSEGKEKAVAVNVFDFMLKQFDESPINCLLIFITLQSLFLLGSVYFQRYSYLLTIICGFIIFFLFFCIFYFFFSNTLPDGEYVNVFPFSYRVELENAKDPVVQIPGWFSSLLKFVIQYTIAPFFWLVTYYRLKEKQL